MKFEPHGTEVIIRREGKEDGYTVVARFVGTEARELAREYAAFKNAAGLLAKCGMNTIRPTILYPDNILED